MPRVRSEPTIPVFEGAKAVHALDRAATVIGENLIGKPEGVRVHTKITFEWISVWRFRLNPD
jgi:hypothetical protein